MIDESSITWLEPQLTNRLLRIIASYLTSGDESGITLLDGHRSEWDYLRLIASHAAEGNELIEQILPGRSQNNHYRMIASQLTGGSTAGITLLPPRSNFEFIRLIASHYTGGDESSVTLLSGDFSENDFLRFWISSLMAGGGEEPGPSYDPDAIAYFDRVAATTVISDANKSVINNFIVQLKADGLWSIMSVCWICRSGYNAGSGTTIFEIKTNTKNGTMTGGPTWTADGTGFSGTYSSSTNYVLTGHTQTMNGSSSSFAVLKDAASDTGGANRIFGGSAAGADPTLLYMDTNKNSVSFGNYDGSTVRAPGASGTNITSFKMIGCVYNPSEPSSDFSKFYTGTAVTQAGGTGGRLTASHTVTLSDNVYGMTAGVGSVFMIFGSNALSAAQVALLYSNLKATICADLSLP